MCPPRWYPQEAHPASPLLYPQTWGLTPPPPPMFIECPKEQTNNLFMRLVLRARDLFLVSHLLLRCSPHGHGRLLFSFDSCNIAPLDFPRPLRHQSPSASLSLSAPHLCVFPKVGSPVPRVPSHFLGEIVLPTSVTRFVHITPPAFASSADFPPKPWLCFSNP